MYLYVFSLLHSQGNFIQLKIFNQVPQLACYRASPSLKSQLKTMTVFLPTKIPKKRLGWTCRYNRTFWFNSMKNFWPLENGTSEKVVTFSCCAALNENSWCVHRFESFTPVRYKFSEIFSKWLTASISQFCRKRISLFHLYHRLVEITVYFAMKSER